MPQRSSHRKALWILPLLGVPVLLSHWVQGQLDATLLTPSFLTGWVLALVLGLSALNWVRAVPGIEGLRSRVGLQLVIGALMLLLFLIHVELRLPDGLLESALTIGFEAMLASVLIGGLIAFYYEPDAARLKRWLRIQVGIHWSVLGVAMFHGVFSHVHSALAYFLFYSSE